MNPTGMQLPTTTPCAAQECHLLQQGVDCMALSYPLATPVAIR